MASQGPVIAERHPGGGLAQGLGWKGREGPDRREGFEKEPEEGELQVGRDARGLPRLTQRFLRWGVGVGAEVAKESRTQARQVHWPEDSSVARTSEGQGEGVQRHRGRGWQIL